MGIFEEKQSVSRRELKSSLEKSSGRIPRTGGEKYVKEERQKIGKEVFGRKYGSEISKRDYKGALRDLKSAKDRAETREEKAEIEDRINYLKKLGGL